MSTETPKLATLEQIHAEYGIPLRTLRKNAAERRIPILKYGRRVYVNRSEFAAWIREQSIPARGA